MGWLCYLLGRVGKGIVFFNSSEITMKKFLACCGVVLTAGMLRVPAYAADSTSYYVSGDVGASWFNNVSPTDPVTNQPQGVSSFDGGINVLGALGVKWCDNYRLEAEYGYQRNNLAKSGGTDLLGNISVTSVLANGYYEVKQNGFVPYFTAGLGWASIGINNVGSVDYPNDLINESHSAFAWQLGAGVAIPVSKNIDIDVRFRHFETSKISLDNQQGDFNISSNSVLAGLRLGI
jgi:opacity protein-like surface antigen